MLKLKRVQILGFKSFCDRTEVQLSGNGIVAIVGPNGCGKSNISDAITWVLGEQSAKSLRGIKMEDVIFAGTRTRKPTGMAEVSLTLVDPEVYDNTAEDEQLGEAGASLAGDWDEDSERRQRAEETEEAVAEAQPGVTYEDEVKPKAVARMDGAADDGDVQPGSAMMTSSGEAAESDVAAASAALAGTAGNVVLRIRRRKFGRAPVRAGEITITRRLFRSGDSEYLLNGKICRLRDIQDIFMGTGLGGESYAIIGQERIGQLLSSKPLDRRAILEEAAGITRFKTKKRLAELRLESARQNLSRVNDIFDEVTRQMAVLKRQAAKAERYGALREEWRGRLLVALASRLGEFDREHEATTATIATLGGQIETQAARLAEFDREHTAGVAQGYALDEQIRAAGMMANQSAVELERIAARTSGNADRIGDLTERLRAGNEELTAMRGQMEGLAREQEQHRSFLENATAEAQGSRDAAQRQQHAAVEAVRGVAAAEQQAEQSRRQAMHLLQRAAQIRNEESQAAASLAGLEREQERLAAESGVARQELETLGMQRGQAKLSFEDGAATLKRLEEEIAGLRREIDTRRAEEQHSRQRANQLRSEVAGLRGRSSSLEGLIREHSYSTDTVKNLFRASAKKVQQGLSTATPLGTLADFLEVDGQFEKIVDEFLRDELNFLVVKSWAAATEGTTMLAGEVNGRATFLVQPEASGSAGAGAGVGVLVGEGAGVTALRDVVRITGVLGGAREAVWAALPKLRDGYVVADREAARQLAQANPAAYFLTASGETFHAGTVTGGRPSAQGPLALKRELAELHTKLEAAEAELGQADLRSVALQKEVTELTVALDGRSHERRDAERESANHGAALRQMEAEVGRLDRRLQEWSLAVERNKDTRNQKADLMARKQQEGEAAEQERTTLELGLADLQLQLDQLKRQREEAQAAASAAAAALAGLDERRRNAQANYDQTTRLLGAQQQRLQQVEAQLAAAAAERLRREQETTELATQHTQLAETRATAVAQGQRLTAELTDLRARLAGLDTTLRALRTETDGLREQRATHTARVARLASDIEHLEAATRNDLGAEPAALREDAALVRVTGEALAEAENDARTLKQRLEAMGPVNMMALEEYNETAERHTFLETQRKDLLDAIENTQQSIKEIDEVSREKFDVAFKAINENFSLTFTKLFGGGQAYMKLTDEASSADSGVDIIASPPGKKLQNVLLLSGGEKALTALSLLVGIFQFQPAPFCILDEVDAPLDETNVGRFAKLVHEMSDSTQFVIITHSKRTMSQADVIYGVTMQEPGVSKIVGVNMNRAGREDAATRRAVA